MEEKKKKRKYKYFLLIVSLIIAGIIAEGIIRIVWEEPNYGYPNGLHIPDDTKGYRYQQNFKGYFLGEKYENIEIKINNQGFRDEEHEYEKNKKRIIVLGDSVTFGAGVNQDDTYVARMQKERRDEIEIINMGVNGYEMDQEYILFLEEGKKYDPDLILLGIVLNDINQIEVQKLKEEMFKEEKKKELRTILGKSCQSCKWIYILTKNLKREKHNKQYIEKIYSLWENETLFEQYKQKVKEVKKEKEIVLIIFPYTEQFNNSLKYSKMPQEKIKKFAKEENIKVLDLTDILDTENYKELYLNKDNVHLNEEGHEKVAREILNFLEKEKMLS